MGVSTAVGSSSCTTAAGFGVLLLSSLISAAGRTSFFISAAGRKSLSTGTGRAFGASVVLAVKVHHKTIASGFTGLSPSLTEVGLTTHNHGQSQNRHCTHRDLHHIGLHSCWIAVKENFGWMNSRRFRLQCRSQADWVDFPGSALEKHLASFLGWAELVQHVSSSPVIEINHYCKG